MSGVLYHHRRLLAIGAATGFLGGLFGKGSALATPSWPPWASRPSSPWPARCRRPSPGRPAGRAVRPRGPHRPAGAGVVGGGRAAGDLVGRGPPAGSGPTRWWRRRRPRGRAGREHPGGGATSSPPGRRSRPRPGRRRRGGGLRPGASGPRGRWRGWPGPRRRAGRRLRARWWRSRWWWVWWRGSWPTARLPAGAAVLLVLKLPMRPALGTSLAVSAALAVPGTVAHGVMGDIDWSLVLVFGAASVPLSALGARTALRVDPQRLEAGVRCGAGGGGDGAPDLGLSGVEPGAGRGSLRRTTVETTLLSSHRASLSHILRKVPSIARCGAP